MRTEVEEAASRTSACRSPKEQKYALEVQADGAEDVLVRGETDGDEVRVVDDVAAEDEASADGVHKLERLAERQEHRHEAGRHCVEDKNSGYGSSGGIHARRAKRPPNRYGPMPLKSRLDCSVYSVKPPNTPSVMRLQSRVSSPATARGRWHAQRLEDNFRPVKRNDDADGERLDGREAAEEDQVCGVCMALPVEESEVDERADKGEEDDPGAVIGPQR